jgi:6-phosphogluconolactonase
LWMVDERCVGDDDPRLNFGAIRDALPSANLHPMPVLRADGADRYERALRDALDERAASSARCLDAVVLGLGPDGHTASLFPNSPALEERQRWIVLNDGAEVVPPRPRMTMTYPLLTRARFIAFLVTGPTKRAALRRLTEGREDYRTLPVAGLDPSPASRLVWYLDRDAAAG